MSYSTTLYAVDLVRLRTAVGSKDSALVERIVGKCLKKNVPVVGKIVRIEVEEDGAIRLDGKGAKIDDLKHVVAGLTGAGDSIRYHSNNQEVGQKVMAALGEQYMAMRAGPEILACKKEWMWEGDSFFLDSTTSYDSERAVRRVVFGEVGNSNQAHEDAYALELICKVLGHVLDDNDSLSDLADLQLGTPLCSPRMPVEMPQPMGFPIVSYLVPNEVASEVSRLNAIDLSFPADNEIEFARRMLFRCLKQASKRKLGVVAFYR